MTEGKGKVRKHPREGVDLYTPITPEIIGLLNQLRDEHGTWRAVAEAVQTKVRIIRRVRQGERSAISMTLLDRIIQKGGIGDLDDFVWFTPDDLTAMGIWKPVVYVEGSKRVRGGSD